MFEDKHLIDICPTCGEDCLRGEATIDMHIYYENGVFYFDECGNEPIVDSFYCWACGNTFTLQEVENQARKLLELDNNYDIAKQPIFGY